MDLLLNFEIKKHIIELIIISIYKILSLKPNYLSDSKYILPQVLKNEIVKIHRKLSS